MVAAIINTLLNPSGLEIRLRRRALSDLLARPRQPSAGWIVEIIGTQGVGKSTLNNAAARSLKGRWFFRHDIHARGPEEVGSGALEALHREIYFRKVRRIEEAELEPWRSITISRQMAVVVYESLIISSHAFPRGFMLDDSLFKNFPQEVLELGGAGAPLWRNRAFIYLRARDTDLAVSRFQGRMAARRERGLFQHPRSDEEVRCRIEEDDRLFDRLEERARAFGCPAIVVHPEDGLSSNLEAILEFQRGLN